MPRYTLKTCMAPMFGINMARKIAEDAEALDLMKYHVINLKVIICGGKDNMPHRIKLR